MENKLYKALALGALAGVRSLAAPMLLSHFLSKNENNPLQNTPLRFLGSSTVSLALKVLSATEMAGDKLPNAPDRIEAPSLFMRGASGALVGAAVYMMHRSKPLEGAFIGTAAAIGATYGSFHLRQYLSGHTRFADPVFGALEDALVVGSGMKAARL